MLAADDLAQREEMIPVEHRIRAEVLRGGDGTPDRRVVRVLRRHLDGDPQAPGRRRSHDRRV